MIGMHFCHVSPDPQNPDRGLIKIGTVKSALGGSRYLLEFQGKNYNFSNVFSSENLEGFAFFNTAAERQQFIAELLASKTPATAVTEDPPAPAVVQ
jgi:hypothetical protein